MYWTVFNGKEGKLLFNDGGETKSIELPRHIFNHITSCTQEPESIPELQPYIEKLKNL